MTTKIEISIENNAPLEIEAIVMGTLVSLKKELDNFTHVGVMPKDSVKIDLTQYLAKFNIKEGH